MTPDQFFSKYNGKGIDFDNSYGFQCVDLYRQYVKEVLGFPQSPALGSGGAALIWDNYLKDHFTRISNTPDGVPEKGDIVIWDGGVNGGVGHIAIFIEGTTNSFKSFDQNWPVGSLCHEQGHYYKNVLGWLHPKGGEPSTGDSMSDLQKEYDECRKQRDQNWNLYQATLKELEVATKDASRWYEVLKLGYGSAAQIKQEHDQLEAAIKEKNAALKLETERAELNRKEFNDLLAACAKSLGTVQEKQQVLAKLGTLSASLDMLEDIQRQFAELQLSSAEQVEELNAEIEQLKLMLKHEAPLDQRSFEDLISAIIKKLLRIVKK